MSESVLVTGGAGFIGSHVAEELVKQGHRVTVLDDLSGGYRENVPDGAEFVRASIRSVDLIESLFRRQKFDRVFHFAAYAAEGLSPFISRFNYENNLIGTVNLVNAAINHGVKRFMFASSAAVYGHHAESGTPAPIDPYAISKLACEQHLEVARLMFGLDYVAVRLHNVYGERQNLSDPYRNVVGIFMRQALRGEPFTIFGDGQQRRCFTYVNDIRESLVALGWREQASGLTFNLGSHISAPVLGVAHGVACAFGIDNPKFSFLPPRQEAREVEPPHRMPLSLFLVERFTLIGEGIAKMAAWAKTVKLHEPRRFDNIEIKKNMPESWREPEPEGLSLDAWSKKLDAVSEA